VARRYFLTSERLGFGLWSQADLPLALGLWSDPDVTRHIGGPFDPRQIAARLEQEIVTHAEYGVQYWPIFLRATAQHVGCCGVRPYRLDDGVYELGFHIRSDCWGRGYATEAAAATIGHAFGTLGASALFAGHNPANEASRRLLARFGFEYTHDELYPPTGLRHPSYLLRRR
jgi:RimJ/RimL family protein N-acetyltransferase